MIVTFHVALFLVYHVWDNYISTIFRRDEDIPVTDKESSDSIDTLTSVNTIATQEHTEETTETTDETTNPEPNPTTTNEPVMQESESKKRKGKEGEGDIQTYNQILVSEEENVCKKLGDSLESKFECFVDPEEGGMRFIPPVYTQRYMVVESILKEQCWTECIKKVVDFGCSELSFEVRNLKKLSWIQEIISVDIDLELLERMYGKVGPSITDHLQPRSTPLTIKVFCGSVGHTNEVLLGTDAVIAIELIEHLYPEDLERLPFTVFGFVKPKIAIFTTPNADFNVLFPNFIGFRHDDHKFEWSRQQFQDWGNNLVQRYPNYIVTYQGIGPGPANTEHLGCCSQMATFIRINNSFSVGDDELHIQDGPYKLIRDFEYPVFVDLRTREEKIRDDANYFITNCRLLSKRYDEEMVKELSLKDIMERVRCYQREKLIGILKKDGFEVITNAAGYEVVLLPESDSEENYSYREFSDEDSIIDINDDVNNTDVTLNCEENWDDENAEPNVSSHCDHSWDPVKTEAKCSLTFSESNPLNFTDSRTNNSGLVANCLFIPDSSNTDSNSSINSTSGHAQRDESESSHYLVCSLDKKCFLSEAVVPDVSDMIDRCSSCHKNSASHKDLDCSVYETPYNSSFKTKNSGCESNSCAGLLHQQSQSKTPAGCNKPLVFDTPSSSNEKDCGNTSCFSEITDLQSKTYSFCCESNDSSTFNTSTYATPCCSQLHKKFIPKSLSLQQLNEHYGSPSLSTELNSSKVHVLTGKQKDKGSKSMEGFKSQESCDLHETSSNASRVVDSGYPDSYSDQNMDMDLTPEQFEDIETESKGSDVSPRSLSPPMPLAPVAARMVDNVENGDVANNNRDGEGNNMVADMEEEPLEFEAQIEEVNHEVQNMAAVLRPDVDYQQFCVRSKSPQLVQEKYAKEHSTSQDISLPDEPLSYTSLSEKPHTPDISEIKSSKDNNIIGTEFNGLANKQYLKSAKSDLSIATSSTWSHLSSADSQTCFDGHEGENQIVCKQDPHKLKTCTSMTTVLDGCSRFSNCSLVRPVEDQNASNKLADKDNTSKNMFPKWLLSIDYPVFGSRGDLQEEEVLKENKMFQSFSGLPQHDYLSLSSIYQSAASLSSLISDNNTGNSHFPEWLLEIQLSDEERDELDRVSSVESVWDLESFEELPPLVYNVQVDSRGGGDPQRGSWN